MVWLCHTTARPQALRSQRAAIDAENGSLPWAKQAIHPLTPAPSIEFGVLALGHQGPLRKSGEADFVAGDASAAGAPERPKSRRNLGRPMRPELMPAVSCWLALAGGRWRPMVATSWQRSDFGEFSGRVLDSRH